MVSESPQEHGLQRLNARDLRVILLWLLAAVVGASVAYRYFFRAFPEASVDFKVTRGEALDQARKFVTARGVSLDGYESTIVFGVDDDQKTYLEREVGLERANRLMASDVNVWYWDVRFFKPLQKEQFRVHVSPAGQIVGYEHEVDEASPGARLDRDAALMRATDFLRNTLHVPLDSYTFLPEEASSEARPARTDWDFTWERTGFRVQEAPYRLQVELQGDHVGGYREFLKVPEAWNRDYQRLRSSNQFLEMIALIPYALLLGAALSVVIALGRRGAADWKWGLLVGLFIAALYFVMELNDWPITRAGYDTNNSYASFALGEIFKAIATSLSLAMLVVIAVLPGEPLYRMDQPNRLRLGSAFTLPGLRTKEFFLSGVIGLCLAAAHIGYVVLFYVVGGHFGVWAPQDLQYSDTLSTALPWISALTIGIYAAASEEFLFRMFSVHFLLRSTRSKFLAIVLSAFAWGFLHSNYPQEPAYIRGLEVGMIGIVAGLVMLRWGILATLTWHYTVDAFLTSLSLMRSGDMYSRISGGVVGFAAVIPVAIAGVLYLSRGGFADAAPLLNRARPLVMAAPAAEPPVARTTTIYNPMTARVMAVVALCGAIGAVLVWGVRPQTLGGYVRFSVDAPEAEARADQFLRDQKVDPSRYRRAAAIQYTFDPVAAEYLRQSIGAAATDRIYREQVPSAFWTVRYFRDSQKEEYFVVLRSDGALHSVHHTLAEAAPGPSLSQDDARSRAEAFLRDVKGFDLSQWKLVAANSQKLPARTDHAFVWEQIGSLNPVPAGAEGAHIRVELRVEGAEVSGYRIFVHVPEAWTRTHTETKLAGTAKTIGVFVLGSAFVVCVLVAFFRDLRQATVAAVPWRRLAGWSCAVVVASIVTYATMQAQYLATYSTDTPLRTFISTVVISLTLVTALSYSGVVFLFGLAWFFLARTYGAEHLPGWRRMPANYYRDAALVGLCGAAAVAGISRLGPTLAHYWAVARYAFPASVPQGLEASVPALNTLSGAVTHSFLAVGLLGLVLGVASWYVRPTWVQVVLLALVAILFTPQAGSAGEFVQNALVAFVEIGVIWWGARRIVRFNLLGYFLAAMILALVPAAVELLRQPNAFFRANGWTVVAAIGALLLWPLVEWWRAAPGKVPTAPVVPVE